MAKRTIDGVRPAPLRVVPSPPVPSSAGAFCARCASAHEPSSGRICDRCGLGLVLRCAAADQPPPGAACAVVDARLVVRALTLRAEAVVGLTEGEAVGTSFLDVLSHAAPDLRLAVAAACAGMPVAGPFPVRFRNAGRCLHAAITPCGPPPAALVVLGTPVPACAGDPPRCTVGCVPCTAGEEPRYLHP